MKTLIYETFDEFMDDTDTCRNCTKDSCCSVGDDNFISPDMAKCIFQIKQSEIDELKSRISELEDTLGRWKDKARNLSLMFNTSYGMYGED